MTVLLFLILLVWLIGACLRIVRQARFYQIEEYMSGRYLRWLLAQRYRWLPGRPFLAWFVGAGLAFFLAEAPGSPLPAIIALLAAGIGAYPERDKEVKKALKFTDRVKRMLAAAFVLAVALALAGAALVLSLPTDSPEIPAVIAASMGFALVIAAPLLLVTGNLLMTPVEALLRARFEAQARAVLAEANLTVIGITGSYGKTSTKTYLAHILNSRYKAYPTPKSYNTLMGVCIAINNDIANNRSLEYFIAEMGAYIPGEIERICDLTHPSISIVVEVGPQHLERFGTLENIASAKYEIIRALPPDGVGVFNWDNPYVRAMYERGYPQTRIAVSRAVDPAQVPADGPRLIASNVEESLNGLSFTVTDTHSNQREDFQTPLLGQHNVTNVLLATAVALHEGVPLKDVARAVRSLQPAESRLVRNVLPEGITVINDAYSANPVGVVHALRVLGMHQTGKRLLITPGMVELGPLMESENRKLGEIAAQYATDVILVGARQTDAVKQGLLNVGFPAERLHITATLAEAVEWYQTNLQTGDTVLFLNDLPDVYAS
ncbi:MAG: UDP-N-acetylmuramoyl-tripeptide--D-alanyl-D-alanine ligase [Chloroflexi bacterium]|nr:UDP-N-acetylmuramoyl-tripeptide--D-alanyl-D-alanine ligase [Chloroflexota bacterium]